MIQKAKKYWFLFTELVKRDFKQKYKGTFLGMLWSLLSPLLQLLIYYLVFDRFFGKDSENYIIYCFSGVVVFNYFAESTKGGMMALTNNAKIFTKVNVPKYLFLFSKNVSALINYGLTLVLYLAFCIVFKVHIAPRFLMLLYPSVCLLVFNLGMGLILSALYIFFRDMQYLYDTFIMLLRYLSAIFYTVSKFPGRMQKFLLLNPVYAYIRYFRDVVIGGRIPGIGLHGLCLFYALAAFGIGALIYRKYNTKFLYYV